MSGGPRDLSRKTKGRKSRNKVGEKTSVNQSRSPLRNLSIRLTLYKEETRQDSRRPVLLHLTESCLPLFVLLLCMEGMFLQSQH